MWWPQAHPLSHAVEASELRLPPSGEVEGEESQWSTLNTELTKVNS